MKTSSIMFTFQFFENVQYHVYIPILWKPAVSCLYSYSFSFESGHYDVAGWDQVGKPRHARHILWGENQNKEFYLLPNSMHIIWRRCKMLKMMIGGGALALKAIRAKSFPIKPLNPQLLALSINLFRLKIGKSDLFLEIFPQKKFRTIFPRNLFHILFWLF